MKSDNKKDKATNEFTRAVTEGHDRFPEYISLNIAKRGWDKKEAVNQLKISSTEIDKIKAGKRLNLTAEKFYRAYKGFGHSCLEAFKFIYPNVELELFEYKAPERNKFGKFMLQFEKEIDENSPRVIAEKTGISVTRINKLYFTDGGLKVHELLLIEAAVGKKPGELFEAFFGGS